MLFDGEVSVREVLTAAIAEAPAGLAPLDILSRAFQAFRLILEGERAYAKPRQEVISTTPALQERELAKIAALSDSLAHALRARGVPELSAILAAQTGMAAFVHATLAWLADPEGGLGERIDIAFPALRGLLAGDT